MVAATSLSSPSLARAICTAAATSSPLPAQHASASSVQPPVIINSGLPPSETKKDWGNFVKEKFESVGQLKSSQVLLELARSRNKIPLPKSIAPPGSIPLPPEQDTLLSQNYQLLPPLKAPTQVEETEEDDNEEVDTNPANPNPNYLGQDQRDTEQQQPLPHTQSQRVSFQLNAVAAAAAMQSVLE